MREMTKSKRSKPHDQVHDRLSELPNSVIFHIFWFMPINDVIRTTILSKRWENLWTTAPSLNFDNDTPGIDDDIDQYRNFVNRTLLRWNGIRVLKFRVEYCYELDNSIYGDVDLWLNCAKERNVEELYLHLLCVSCLEKVYIVPKCLYSCSSIKLLSLKCCEFRINGNVLWNQLRSLTVTECFGVTKRVINQILSASPLLEVLTLSFIDRGEDLNIRSISLKELSICKYFPSYDQCVVSELTIWTPNLETLEIKGIPYTNCRLMDVSSLRRATIGFKGLVYWRQNNCDFPGTYLKTGLLSSQDYFGEKFSEILQYTQHVGSVTLFYCCLKVLRAMKKRCMHSPFPNVKSLTIGYCYGKYDELVGLLEIFPQLERLVLKDEEEDDSHDAPEAVEYQTSIPKSFLLQLRTIEVSWKHGDNIFPLIEIVLQCASKLRKMVFKIKGYGTSRNSLLSASNKLMNMPRSSTNCKIEMMFSNN